MNQLRIKDLIRTLRGAQAKEYDGTIAISGFVGEGKSTLSMNMFKAYYGFKTLEEFKKGVDKYLCYSRKAISDLTVNSTKNFIIADEAINILFKREFATGDQRKLIKLFDVCRDMHHIFVFNIPSFWALDKHTVQTRIRLWIYVEKQKYAHIFKPIRNPFALDVWARKYNEKLMQNKRAFSKSPNYISTMTFNALSPEEYKYYKSVKHKKRLAVEDEEKPKEKQLTKKDVIKFIASNGNGVTQDHIAEAIGATRQYVQQILRKASKAHQ